MNVVIKLEEKVAEVHIVPTSPLNKAQLALVRNYGDKALRIKHGDGEELIFVFEYTNGSEKLNAEDKAKPNPLEVPKRSLLAGDKPWA
jgi:hypothetical protein